MSAPSYRQLVGDARNDLAGSTSFTVWSLLAAVAGLVIGLSIGLRYSTATALSGALGGPAAGLLLVMLITEVRARRRATERYFHIWASDHGWAYDPAPPVYQDTPLLRAGDEQLADRAFAGRMLGAHHGCVYQHTRRDESSSTDSRGVRTRTVNDRHYVVARIELPLRGIERLLLHPRGFAEIHLFDAIESKLTSNELVELESAEFDDAYKLQVADGTDPALVRELFTPEAIVQLVDFDGGKPFEYGLLLEAERGAAVFASQGRIDIDTLDFVDDMLARAEPFAQWLSAFAGERAPS